MPAVPWQMPLPFSCEAVGPAYLVFRGDVLPVREEAHELGATHRLDLRPQPVEGVSMDARQQSPFAPRSLAVESCAEDRTVVLEREKERVFLIIHGDARVVFENRTERFESAEQDFLRLGRTIYRKPPVAAAEIRKKVRRFMRVSPQRS